MNHFVSKSLMIKQIHFVVASLLVLSSCLESGQQSGGSEGIDLFGIEAVLDARGSAVQPITSSLSPTERLLEATVTLLVSGNHQEVSQGSGVFIERNRLITNFHVIEDGNEIEVYDAQRNYLGQGRVVSQDEVHDVAVVECTAVSRDVYFPVEKVDVKVGDEIYVAGAPTGLSGTLSTGIISALRDEDEFDVPLIQITAPISPGSSGGPVMDKSGKLIGIAVGSMTDGQALNFAVPSAQIKNLLDRD